MPRPNDPRDGGRDKWLALLVITAVGSAFRLANLFQPLRYDEAVSYLDFARQPLMTLLSEYRLPNNHIFHSLLVHLATALLGDGIWTIRLPAFLAGCAVIPLSYAVGRRLATPSIALFAAALAAGSGALTLYSINARGYSLVVCATLVLYWIVLEATAATRRWHWPLFAVVTALGFWTIPIMLYPLGGVLAWAASATWSTHASVAGMTRRSFLQMTIAACGGGFLALILYLPVIRSSGLGALVANSYVAASSAATFYTNELPTGLANSARFLTLGLAAPAALCLLVVALMGCIVQFRRTKVMPPLVAALLWSGLLLMIMRRFPYPRIWLFLAPLCCLAAAEGIVWLVSQFVVLQRRLSSDFFPVGLAAVLVVTLFLNRAVYNSRDTGTLYDAEALAIRIKEIVQPGDKIVVATWAPLMYWLERYGVERYLVLGEEAGATRALVVVNSGEDERVPDALSRFGSSTQSLRVDTVGQFPRALLLSVKPR